MRTTTMIRRMMATLLLLVALPALAQEPKPPQFTPDEEKLAAEAVKLNGEGFQLFQRGYAAEAIVKARDALEIRRKLYPAAKHPDGHPDLAGCLNTLGALLAVMGSYEKALPHYEQALAMYRKLYPAAKYPDGHRDLAQSINNLGGLLNDMGSIEKALPHYEQALAMYRKLYPPSQYSDGHPQLAGSINNLGALLNELGSHEEALPHYEQALAMYRKLYPAAKYPDGHPNLATNINSLGILLQVMGQSEKALSHFEEALAMRQKLGRRMLAMASEAEALAFVTAQPMTRDSFLSFTRHLPDTAASAYVSVWSSKSAITRVLEQRHAAARVTGTEHAAELDDLKGLRRRIDQLLQDRRMPPAERDKLLIKLTEDRDTLERELAKVLPLLKRAKELDALGPDALTPLLRGHEVMGGVCPQRIRAMR